jgi:hypothetical protein
VLKQVRVCQTSVSIGWRIGVARGAGDVGQWCLVGGAAIDDGVDGGGAVVAAVVIVLSPVVTVGRKHRHACGT